jgi:hypothetical protein
MDPSIWIGGAGFLVFVEVDKEREEVLFMRLDMEDMGL